MSARPRIWERLASSYDDLEWNRRTDQEIYLEIQRQRPMWLRIGNFYRRNLSLLRMLPPGQLVLWKLEHFGDDAANAVRMLISSGLQPESFVAELFASGHTIVPYTFTTTGRDNLVRDVPLLRTMDIQILPLAHNMLIRRAGRTELRASLGLGEDDILVGAGGRLFPEKGIDEIATWFLRQRIDAHLLCSAIPADDRQSVESVRIDWQTRSGTSDSARLHLRFGHYDQPDWMSSFYAAIDVMLVNSMTDSWGRMASEAITLGVPAIVRRADCGTNELAPNVVLVNGFEQLSTAEFAAAFDQARKRASRLQEYMAAHYDISVVRRQFHELLREYVPASHRAEFIDLAAELHPSVDRMLTF
ncbi:hypothetical protein ACQPW1_29565 [Nocardia sp. CA-128927]|uniref:hypothetical protein n=1 Tax=Nocardia sp. CA-128927 TaxID=3239975 RepID=UPI003D97C97C